MSEKMRILFIGDSVTDVSRTDVLRAWEGWLRDPSMTAELRTGLVNSIMGMGYPVMAAGQLSAEEPGIYEFLNRGVSGNRIVDVDARIKVDCINLKPDLVSIMIGINDVWHEIDNKNGVDNGKFRRVYDAMLAEIAAALPGVRFIIIEPFCLKGASTDAHWDYFRAETDLRRETVKELAEKYNAPLLRTQELFDAAAARGCAADFSMDGVHPNPAGHWLVAREWVRLFREMK